jgi:intracellular multiplication protein IcmV
MPDVDDRPKRKYVRGFFKSFIDVRRWSSYDQLKANGKVIKSTFRVVFSLDKKPIIVETFDEAVARLNLTDEALQKKRSYFLQSALLYVLMSLTLLGYGLYLIRNNPFAALAVFLFSILMSIYAYRESMWHMQITKRKLGCGFKEWLHYLLSRGKI